jgi:hypothetical protein
MEDSGRSRQTHRRCILKLLLDAVTFLAPGNLTTAVKCQTETPHEIASIDYALCCKT